MLASPRSVPRLRWKPAKRQEWLYWCLCWRHRSQVSVEMARLLWATARPLLRLGSIELNCFWNVVSSWRWRTRKQLIGKYYLFKLYCRFGSWGNSAQFQTVNDDPSIAPSVHEVSALRDGNKAGLPTFNTDYPKDTILKVPVSDEEWPMKDPVVDLV